MPSKFCHPDYRSLLALIIKYDPGARAAVRHMWRLRAVNLRPDYFTFRTHHNTIDRAVDPSAWYADCRGGIFVSMVRHGDNDWTLHS